MRRSPVRRPVVVSSRTGMPRMDPASSVGPHVQPDLRGQRSFHQRHTHPADRGHDSTLAQNRSVAAACIDPPVQGRWAYTGRHQTNGPSTSPPTASRSLPSRGNLSQEIPAAVVGSSILKWSNRIGVSRECTVTINRTEMPARATHREMKRLNIEVNQGGGHDRARGGIGHRTRCNI